jgi:hypothetical protein
LLPFLIFFACALAQFYFVWRMLQVLKTRHPAVYKGIYRFGYHARGWMVRAAAEAMNHSTIRNFPNVHLASG